MSKTYTHDELVERVCRRYADTRAFAVLKGVADSTGAQTHSWIDAVVLDLWPSKGLCRRAFEAKASRSDWLRELKNPGKNQWARECFHEFWYVAATDVIKEEELPAGCGWMRPHGLSLAVVRHASRKDDIGPADDLLLASLARSMQDEKDAYCRQTREQMRNEDWQFKEARVWQETTATFLSSRGLDVFLSPSEDAKKKITTALEKAASDKASLKKLERATARLTALQTSLLNFFDLFAVAAFVGFMETHETLTFLGSIWGVEEDTTSLVKCRANKPRDKQLSNAFEFLKARAKELIEAESAGQDIGVCRR